MWTLRNALFFVLFLCSEIYPLLANDCDAHIIQDCEKRFLFFENEIFPFYGDNETELDKTCAEMNKTFECLLEYGQLCDGNLECNEACEEKVDQHKNMFQNSGLPSLYEKICGENEPLRKRYLQHIDCLKNTSEKYSACHIIAVTSQDYMQNNRDSEGRETWLCCFYTWYQGCYMNATMDTCGYEATLFVSHAHHLTMGKTFDKLCNKAPVCSHPPLPNKGGHTMKTDIASTNDKSSASKINYVSKTILSVLFMLLGNFNTFYI